MFSTIVNVSYSDLIQYDRFTILVIFYAFLFKMGRKIMNVKLSSITNNSPYPLVNEKKKF